jgi:hypothetical protein
MQTTKRSVRVIRRISVVAPASVLARILSAVGILATATLLALIFVVPGYSSQGEHVSSNGRLLTTNQFSGGGTVFAANPSAAPLIIGVAALAIGAALLALSAAWFHVPQAAAMLGLVLLPLSAVAVLALPSIGLFIVPTVVIGWVVFGLCREADQRTTT